MHLKMDVLLLGRRGNDQKAAAFVLEDAGHRVHRCFEDGSAWGCAALTATCPMDQPIDVVVATADYLTEGFASQGVACAKNAGLPVAVIGAFSDDPILQHAAGNIDLVGPDLPDQLARIIDRFRRRTAAQSGLDTPG